MGRIPVRGTALALAVGALAVAVFAGAVLPVSSSSTATTTKATVSRPVARPTTTVPVTPVAKPPKPVVVHRRASLPRGTIVMTLPHGTWGHVIPNGFLGLGIEYQTLPHYTGRRPKAIDPVFEQLLRNLSPGEAPELRIGGDTTDWGWWPAHGLKRPAGARFKLTPHWVAVARALATDLGAHLIIGINLEADSPQIAAAEAHALLSRLGTSSVEALELGNEPELFSVFGWYRAPDGREVPGRPANFNFATYLREYTKIIDAMPRYKLAGPAFGGPRWLNDWGAFFPAEPSVRIATLHRYPLYDCVHPSSTLYPSISHLLSAKASHGLAESAVPFVRTAHADHLPVRIDEMNTTPCPGAAATLRTFAEALWALRALFEMADVHVNGVNMQTTAAATDDLFSFTHVNGFWRASVQPEYYGLLTFAQAAPPGSHLVRLTKTSSSPIQAWATRARDHTVRVVLINEGSHQQTVAIRSRKTAHPATLERLEAPSVSTKYGMTLGGQTFGPSTDSGRLDGPRRTTRVRPVAGNYVVLLPATSAAMLTIP
jgi:Glycosyl hydrolase family 79 C-terminal beta domain